MKTGFNVKTQIKTRLQQLAKQVGWQGRKTINRIFAGSSIPLTARHHPYAIGRVGL